MRLWLARLVHPKMCSADIEMVSSYAGPNRFVGDDLLLSHTVSTWRVCGKRPGHDGEHGSWGRWFMWRCKFANWIGP